MAENRFGLKRRPFSPLPDTEFYYPATQHETALAHLLRGIADDEGVLVLTGVPGAGKTLLGYVLLERLGDTVVSAFLTTSHLADRAALLQAILFDLGLPYDGTEQTLRLRLTEQLLKTCADKKRTVIVIDEAHHLSADLLEELRLLANLEAGGGKAVQFVLLAQPSILATLGHSALSSLQQRITVRATIAALDVEEAFDYLLHQVRLAGGKPEKIFEETALEVIARGSHGIPRCLNQAARQALLLAEEGELTKVDAEAALEGLSLLGLSDEEAGVHEEPTPDGEGPHPHIQKFIRTA